MRVSSMCDRTSQSRVAVVKGIPCTISSSSSSSPPPPPPHTTCMYPPPHMTLIGIMKGLIDYLILPFCDQLARVLPQLGEALDQVARHTFSKALLYIGFNGKYTRTLPCQNLNPITRHTFSKGFSSAYVFDTCSKVFYIVALYRSYWTDRYLRYLIYQV
jgi:hypothetical protein